MKATLIALVLAAVALGLAGCGEKELDCKNPHTQKEQQTCVGDEMTDNSIGRTPNPKKW